MEKHTWKALRIAHTMYIPWNNEEIQTFPAPFSCEKFYYNSSHVRVKKKKKTLKLWNECQRTGVLILVLELPTSGDPPALASKVLGLQTWATLLGLILIYIYNTLPPFKQFCFNFLSDLEQKFITSQFWRLEKQKIKHHVFSLIGRCVFFNSKLYFIYSFTHYIRLSYTNS